MAYGSASGTPENVSLPSCVADHKGMLPFFFVGAQTHPAGMYLDSWGYWLPPRAVRGLRAEGRRGVGGVVEAWLGAESRVLHMGGGAGGGGAGWRSGRGGGGGGGGGVGGATRAGGFFRDAVARSGGA